MPHALSTLPFLLTANSPLSLLLCHCLHAVWIFCHPFLMAPFMSNPNIHLGCLGRVYLLPLPFSLTQCPHDLQSFNVQASSSSHSHSFCMTPFTSNPGMPPWLLQWGHLWILLLPGGTGDLSVLCPGLQEGLARFFFSLSWGSLYLPR